MRATRWVLLSVVVALCCLSTAPVWASDARLEALAVQREYIEDYFNFRTFPTVAARYQNLVQAGLGSRDGSSFNDDMSVGVIGAGDNTGYGVFGLFLNEVKRDVFNGVEGVFETVEQQQLDLTWAKDFSGATVGASVLYMNSEVKASQEKESPIGGGIQDLDGPNANQLGLTGGVKFDLSGKSMLELAAGLAWWSWEETDAAGMVTSEDDGTLSYQLAGRIFSEVTSRTTLVPLIRFSKMDLTEKAPAGGTAEEVSRQMINLGVALHYEVNGNDMLVLGLSVDNIKDTNEATQFEESVWSTPNLFAALEFDVYSWLTVRTGVTKGFVNSNEKDLSVTPAAELDRKESDYMFGLGMGVHFDHFDVDATLDPEALFTGGYFLSGESSQPLTRITATYYF